MIVGDTTLDEVSPLIDEAEETLAREINPHIFTAAEFREKRASGHHFITQVMAGEKVFLIGGEDVLAEAAG